MTTIEALEAILEEGQSDETGGQYGLDELDEIAIRATEPVAYAYDCQEMGQ